MTCSHLYPVPERKHTHFHHTASKLLRRRSIKRATKLWPKQIHRCYSYQAVRIKTPHTQAVIDTSELLRVAFAFLTSPERQSAAKKKLPLRSHCFANILQLTADTLFTSTFLNTWTLGLTGAYSSCSVFILLMSFLFKERRALDCNYRRVLRIRHLTLEVKVSTVCLLQPWLQATVFPLA